jgi:mono/diheme cytochrome c family protein
VTLAALTNETIGWIIFIVIVAGVVVYALINILRAGKKEIGSEIEVAANRKPYLPDDQLEGPKLDRVLTIALLALMFIAVALPLYWILEPGRQANAAADFNRKFVDRGAALFAPTGTTAGALNLNCAGCHGGMKATGGQAPYNLTLPDGTIKVVQWRAPALNTVLLRFSREEVTYILTYGRPFSPMPAWGLAGGGPLNDQQIQNLIDYLESIQITPEQAQQQARDGLVKMMALKNPDGTPVYKSEGEALFNMGLGTDVAAGAYSCGRCHTQGWSYATDYSQVQAISGCGALGPSLCGGSVDRQFPASDVPAICDNGSTPPPGEVTTTSLPPCQNPYQDQIDFVTTGSETGKKYGEHGQGTGRMPGFGKRSDEPGNETFQGSPGALFWINKGKDRTFPGASGMLPADLIDKIVLYERSLP